MSLCKTSMQQANNKFVRALFLLSAALFFSINHSSVYALKSSVKERI